jgi:Tol biopolymer transport system component
VTSFRMHTRVMPLLSILLLAVFSCSNSAEPKSTLRIEAAPYAEPAWHPSGGTIFFLHTPLTRITRDPRFGTYTVYYDQTQSGTWVIRADGTGETRLSPTQAWTADWDNLRTSVAFETGAEIQLAAASDTTIDFSGAATLSGGDRSFAPSWSPSGHELAYSVHAGSAAGIYIVPRTGGASRRIGMAGWREPDWSPDGARFTFIASIAGKTGVCVSDTLGNSPTMLWGYANAYVSFPRWSPDGAQIAFTGRSSNDGTIDLRVMGSDGSGIRTLATGVQDFFSWSPDGSEIAYVSYSLSSSSIQNGTIWIVSVATGAKRQLTFNRPSG